MDFSAGAAIGAGLVGSVAMAMVRYLGIAMMPRRMTRNLFYMLGTMLTRNKGAAYVGGGMIHLMMGIGFALVHAAAYQVFGLTSAFAAWGILFGLVHWLMAGMGMGMVGSVHPMMRSGEMQAPGVLVKNFPSMTVAGFLMMHVMYGLLVGVLYEAWA